MSILAGLLTSGCQNGNSLEEFAKSVESAKSIRMEATLKEVGGSRPVTTLRKLPHKAKTVSNESIAIVNETDGWLEVDSNKKMYHQSPWIGKFSPSLAKLAPQGIASCHPAYGMSPLKIAPSKSWKASKKGSSDVWTTEVATPAGMQKFEIEIGSDGTLRRYLCPNGEFTINKWELNPSIDDKEFTFRLPDGYVAMTLPAETMDLYCGQKLDFRKFVDNHRLKPGAAWSFVVFTDPADSISSAMKKWLSKAPIAATKLEVSLGPGGDYSISDPKEFWKLVSATPTACLINKEGIIQAMWQGFDSTQTAQLEKEIALAIKENS